MKFKITAEERDFILERRAKNGGKGLGPGGMCKCPTCGFETNHNVDEPCNNMLCPQCGTKLERY